ncbi:hypothetical protein GCM10027589_12760 [Actinocorallia lasiicapitis]
MHYRHAFGLSPQQKLITVASTWREDSLFGLDPLFTTRLLGRLPFDRYRVALILHPNIWASHSAFQIRAWLAEAVRAGLILLPPEQGWRAAVIAADWVLSDHGSVGMYAAAAGRPVLLEQSGRAVIDPASGLGRLFDVAAPLDPHAPLEPQLHRADQLRDRTHATAETWISSAPGRSLHLIRERLYTLLDATPPETGLPVLADPSPAVDGSSPASLWVRVEPAGPRAFDVERRPAAVTGSGPGVLVVADRELDHRLTGRADVVWTTADDLPGDETSWSASVFAHRPGLTLTMVLHGRHATLRARDGQTVRVSVPEEATAELVCTVLAERHVSGVRDLAALSPLTLRLGPDQTVATAFSAVSS